jgi:hypothetical protein
MKGLNLQKILIGVEITGGSKCHRVVIVRRSIAGAASTRLDGPLRLA